MATAAPVRMVALVSMAAAPVKMICIYVGLNEIKNINFHLFYTAGLEIQGQVLGETDPRFGGTCRRKTLVYLILALYHMYPDYDFRRISLSSAKQSFHRVYTHCAVKTTGNVFCYEELNIKTKNWKELLTDETFTRDDLITIQNPNALDQKVLLDFDHVKQNLKIDDEGCDLGMAVGLVHGGDDEI
ncbi:hypothetical protein RYX36_002952 [Vicia faba]